MCVAFCTLYNLVYMRVAWLLVLFSIINAYNDTPHHYVLILSTFSSKIPYLSIAKPCSLKDFITPLICG